MSTLNRGKALAATIPLVVLVGSTTTACGEPASVQVVGDGPRIIVDQRPALTDRMPRMDIALSPDYTLRYDPDTRCLYVEEGWIPPDLGTSSTDGPQWNIVWPPGSRPFVDDESRGVTLPDGAVVREDGPVHVRQSRAGMLLHEQDPGNVDAQDLRRVASEPEVGLEQAWRSCDESRPLNFVREVKEHDGKLYRERGRGAP